MVKFSTSDIPDLKDKVILVTGGNTGLGYEAIKALAAHSPTHIYMASRSADKAATAIATLHTLHPSTPITHLPLDLTSLSSIRSTASQFLSLSPRLDILMLNAGIMAVPPGHTSDGFEIQLGTNHLGHFLLTTLLLPLLHTTAAIPNTPAPRVVALTSDAYKFARTRGPLFDQKQLEQCNAWGRYGYSKLANILFAQELGRRNKDLVCVSVHPGLVDTDLYASTRKTNLFLKVGLLVGGWVRVSAERGALGQVWAAVAPVGKGGVESGGFYTPVGVKTKIAGVGGEEGVAGEFWEWSEKQIEGKGA